MRRSAISSSSIDRRRKAAASAPKPKYLRREQDIRAAAGRVFLEKGFHAASLADIAAEAGMDRASLYYYVESKHKLFRDIVSTAVEANIAAAQAVLDDPGLDSRQKLRQVIVDLMTSYERNHPFLQVFVQEDIAKLKRHAAPDEERWVAIMETWNTQYRGIFKEIIERGTRDGSFASPTPTGALANLIIGALSSAQLWYSPGGALGASAFGDSVASLFIDGLGVPATD